MGGVSILGSTQPIRDALNRVEDIGRDPSSVLRALGAGVVRHTKWRIDEGIDPRGVRWESYAPLNPIYASTKKGTGILLGAGGTASGLYATLTQEVQGNKLVWGSEQKYARIHQLGGVITPTNSFHLRFRMGGKFFQEKSVTIPARPYLGFTDQDRQFLIGELEGYLARALRG